MAKNLADSESAWLGSCVTVTGAALIYLGCQRLPFLSSLCLFCSLPQVPDGPYVSSSAHRVHVFQMPSVALLVAHAVQASAPDTDPDPRGSREFGVCGTAVQLWPLKSPST